MKTKTHYLLSHVLTDHEPGYKTLSKKEKMLKYYEVAGPDYQAWSPSFNMHFGLYVKGMNPLVRETMLNKMNEEVLEKLNLPATDPNILADLGCGLGATARFAAKRDKNTRIIGITLVPWQVKKGIELTTSAKLNKQVSLIEGDYTHTPLPGSSVDGAYAIESCCHAEGPGKYDLIKEASRILKPGKKFVIADGFIKIPQKNGIVEKAYRKLCDCWTLKELGQLKQVKEALHACGFKDIHIEDVSWRVAPSVAHVPFTVVWFLLKQLFVPNQPMTKERWNNLTAPLLTMIVGLSRKHFGYYVITATKL